MISNSRRMQDGDGEGLYEERVGDLGGEELGGSEQSAGTSSSGPPSVLENPVSSCPYESGGSEFSGPYRFRDIQRAYPEDFELLDEQLQEVVGKYVRAALRKDFQTSRRYLSEVVLIRDVGHRRRLIKWFAQCGPNYPGRLFIWVDEGDHIHTIHDCPWSGGQCRCRFTQTTDFRGHVRKSLRSLRFIGQLDKLDWTNVFIYFVMQKRESRCEVWIDGRLFGLPGDRESVLWGRVQETARAILARETEGTGHNSGGGQCHHEVRKRSILENSNQPPQKKGKFEKITQTVQILLDKYACIPPTELKDIIPEYHDDYHLSFHDPKNLKMYDAACHIAMLTVNRKTLKDFKEYYDGKTPLFYASDMNPFTYYHDRVTSANYLNELILYQCRGDADKVVELLTNIKTWFNRLGWSMPTVIDGKTTYELNPKINCICIVGPPNSGKNYFWDAIAAIAMNVGHIGRVNNKVNQFALQDCYNRRLVMGNEINMEEGAKEDFKKFCEGTAFNIRVKYQGDKIFKRTPACLISNSHIEICYDPHFNNVRLYTMMWRNASFLKDSKKKPYPLAIFDLYDLYNVSLD
ncbi:nonstructural protein [Bat associated densovirus]|uniref:Nonstructural protein n=1 Tax=Bat-associated densovirus 2 TaxID=3070185 RepID=A0A7M1PVL0_9VIRU|nr:nonstructural protein [Bat associated densovirus]QOR29553.1 nonstructural protein [Bat-associated densovirus 2]